MSRKDFVLIAEVLKQTEASKQTITVMAKALKVTNPRFDTDRFITACTPTE